MVSAWRDGRAEGLPDYLCQVARDEKADDGVVVVEMQAHDGTGAYRSRLDIEFDASPATPVGASPTRAPDLTPAPMPVPPTLDTTAGARLLVVQGTRLAL
jgi:hypothetical protein